MTEVYKKGPIELRLGDYRDVLADVEPDAVITDPPYGDRTHAGQRHRRYDGAETIATVGKECHPLPYARWAPGDASAFADTWASSGGWIVALTSHDLFPVYEHELQARGRYVFAPVPCVQTALNVRLAGDGPSNWTCWAVMSRPKGVKGGTRPGAYVGSPFDKGENTCTTAKRMVPGGKPIWLMRALVRDYSRPGDLVCDPCAGGGTTPIAAALEGRRAIGAELDPETYAKACARIERTALTPPLPGLVEPTRKAVQLGLLDMATEAAE